MSKSHPRQSTARSDWMLRASAPEEAAATTSSETTLTALDGPPAVLFTTSACPYCLKAKEALQNKSIDYEEIDVTQDLSLLEKLRESTGMSTVPQIFIGGQFIGGYDDLIEASGSLTGLLVEAAATRAPTLPTNLRELVVESQDKAPVAPPSRTRSAPGDHGAGVVAGLSMEVYREAEGLALLMCSSDGGVGTVSRGLPWNRKSNCFAGAEAVTWLCQNAPDQAPSREAAVALASRMQNMWLLKHINSTEPFADSEKVYFQFTKDDPNWPLNLGRVWVGGTRLAVEVAEDLRQRIEQLYALYLSSDGRQVDYEGMLLSKEFCEFLDATGELQKVDLFQLSRDEKTAFFINVYNMLIIHGTVVRGSPSDTLGRVKFFNSIKYMIGGNVYSADEIENGILRGNRAGAASPLCVLGLPQYAPPPFKSSDPRALHPVQPLDPRIHFALVCGAKGCPPVRIYSAEELDQGLDAAARAFCEDVQVDEETRQVTLSQIFKWYKIDFGATDTDVLRYVAQYLNPVRKQMLLQMLNEPSPGSPVQVVYAEYDWALNSK
eukprot:CAMPEP_0197856262 /NCGR_PEP_ID=MMETSP1438-20131217/28240_1 /TAXON_ID=1461541 /ORGANISM="Pterosperma sp., Strain CCMP1384" /LENGTH=548 /DNA_ID=CAMNT_0043471667 /DNA_START=559 /DNA_END=2205 /DNA_ORIENTATION=+